MKRVATLSPVPGFVPRGPHPDGGSYYRDSSVDQHTIFVCSLWRYSRSALASDDDRAFIRHELDEFARRGAAMYLEMIFRDSFYHADPHPGNQGHRHERLYTVARLLRRLAKNVRPANRMPR